MDAVSSTGVATGLGLLIGAMLPIVPPPGPGDLLTPAILGGLMAKKSNSKKRKPNPAIGDPAELLASFEREVDRFAELEQMAKEVAVLVRQMEVETSGEPKVWTAYDTLSKSRYQDMIRIAAWTEARGGIYGVCKQYARPLFLAIHQQLALPPALAKKVDTASRYWGKTSLRFSKPAWAKALRYVSHTGLFGPILAYEGLLKDFRKHIALAKEAIAAGVSHDAESSKTTLQAGPFRLVNTAHFSDDQMQSIGAVVREAAQRLTDIGLARVCYGDVLMSRQLSSRGNVLAFYLSDSDEMFVRGDVKDDDRAGLLHTVCHELGHRLQIKFMTRNAVRLANERYETAKLRSRFARSEKHYFPAPGTKIETPIGELTFLGYERLGVVAYLDPKGERRLAGVEAWKSSMAAWDRHYGRDEHFISHYASTDPGENFAELVAGVAVGKAAPRFVEALREMLKADGIDLLVHRDEAAQRGAELQASVSPDEYAAILETPEADERKENPVTLSPTKQDWPGKSRGVPLSSLPQDELARGIEHEREHIPNRYVAQRIAADHLVEDPSYYTHLDAMERQANPVGPLPEGLRLVRTHLGVSGRDQHHFVLDAFVPGWEKRIARVSYDVHDDVGYINMVEVDPAFTRRGVATEMYRHLAKDEPDLVWDRGMATEDGGHFRAATKDILPIREPSFYSLTDEQVMARYGATTAELEDEMYADETRQTSNIAEWIKTRRKANPVGHHAALPLAEVKRWEPVAAASGVSDVARGPSGFLTAYKRAGGRLDRLSEQWQAKREAFIARHMAQAKSERMFDGGLPTRRHLALIMWAYSPEASKLRQASPRKANPVDENQALTLLREAAGASSKVKWREADGAREYMIVAHGKSEVKRIADALTSAGAVVTHDFYAEPDGGYRALHLRLSDGATVQVKTTRMATLAYATQGVENVDDESFGKLCDLAAYADEGDAHAARTFDAIPVTDLRSQIAR